MAFVEQAHVNDIGTIFRVTVYDTTSTGGTTVADISTASTKKFTFKRPDGTTFERTAVFTTDGSDGNVQYISVDGDLNGPGTWNLQAYVATGAGTWNTSVGTFKVHENLQSE
tara:strand:- start:815 stop:1150 length:336 start_codon:yes stop_codon:yes gene_type:complete